MEKVAQYLQEHIAGEVITSKDARRYFATDASVFELEPQIIVYPRNSSDVRKVARFSWQLAERGKQLPITARGKGSDQSGGSLGGGVMVVFPAHMNKLLELDTGKGVLTVQAGALYGDLQNTLHTHGRFLPPYPSSLAFSSIGGAIANNAGGEKSVKYGQTRKYVRELDVVLANGELIHTIRLNKRELNRKKGLTSFEGEVYRQLDNLITDNWERIQNIAINTTKNSAGYALADVKRKDGSFDLTPLLVGSQSTLGVITEAVLQTDNYNPNPTLISASFENIDLLNQAIEEILKLGPSVLEVVDKYLLDFIRQNNPNQLLGLVEDPHPAFVMLAEFDDITDRKQKRLSKKAVKILKNLARDFSVATDEHERDMLWKIRHSTANIIWHSLGTKKSLPIIEDGVVPRSRMREYITSVYSLFAKYNLQTALWGHAGDANFHMQPFLDLSKVGDRQMVFKIMDEYYQMVIGLGGSTSGEHNDGRLRAPYLPQLYGNEVYDMFKKVKKIFDPYNSLNPGVKIDVTQKDIAPLLRKEYSVEHLSDHLPRT